MPMTNNAREAFNRLLRMGVPVMDWGEREGYGAAAQFVLIHASRDGRERFADINGEWVRESWVNGEYINPMGIRQDIHEVLEEHRLRHDWQNPMHVVIYECDAARGSASGPSEPVQAPIERSGQGASEPPMSHAALSAMKELARLGAPVWDCYSHKAAYPPEQLPPGAQFVMLCSPQEGVLFANPEWNPEQGASASVREDDFSATQGLRPDVFQIVQRNGLQHGPFTFRRADPRFPPVDVMVFYDPAASPEQRGA